MKHAYVCWGLLPLIWIGNWTTAGDAVPADFEDISVELSFAPSQSNDKDILIVQTLSGVHVNRKVTVFTTSLTFSGTAGGMRVGGKAGKSVVQSINTPAISTHLAFALIYKKYPLLEEGGSICADWTVTVDGSAPFSIRSKEYSIIRKGNTLTVSKLETKAN